MRVLGLLFAILAPGLVSGQVTITSQDIPKVGDEVYYSMSSSSIDYTGTGPDYTWDFSDLEPQANDTFKFINPPGAYALIFFGSIALEIEFAGHKRFQFFQGGSGGWRQIGAGAQVPVIGTDMPLRYDDPDLIYKFPLNYNDSHSDTFWGSAFIQDLTVTVHGRRNTVVDGWGSITTPFGTFECLRVKSEIREIDTLIMGIDNSRTEYTWLAKGLKMPVLQVTVPEITQSAIIRYRDSARGSGNAGIRTVEKPGFKIYPNPAKEKVTVELPAAFSGKAAIGIYTLAGRLISEQRFANANQRVTIDVSMLENGFYLLKVDTGKATGFHKLILER